MRRSFHYSNVWKSLTIEKSKNCGFLVDLKSSIFLMFGLWLRYNNVKLYFSSHIQTLCILVRFYIF